MGKVSKIPIYYQMLNFRDEILKIDASKTTAGYVAIPDLPQADPDENALRSSLVEIASVECLLEALAAIARDGTFLCVFEKGLMWTMTCADNQHIPFTWKGETVYLVPQVAFFVTDMKENWIINLLEHVGNSACPCPTCVIPRSDLGVLSPANASRQVRDPAASYEVSPS